VVAASSGDRLDCVRQDGRAPQANAGAASAPRRAAIQKTLFVLEQARSDVVRRHQRWRSWQTGLDPRQLVFIDETWIKTNMTPLRGWGPKGKRLRAFAPHGHWLTLTFPGALRCDGLILTALISDLRRDSIFGDAVIQWREEDSRHAFSGDVADGLFGWRASASCQEREGRQSKPAAFVACGDC